MFAKTIQPPVLSLFSSTSSHPFALFSAHMDRDLPEDSGLVLLRDDSDEVRAGGVGVGVGESVEVDDKFVLRSGSEAGEGKNGKGLLRQTVLHIQSPTVSSTYIRSPPLPPLPLSLDAADAELGIELPYVHFQLRPLGSRPLALQVGIRDVRGQRGRVRASNFQARPTLYPAPPPPQGKTCVDESPSPGPLLHLPLGIANGPEKDRNSITGWCTLSLPLAHLVPHLHNPALLSLESAAALAGANAGAEQPNGDGFGSGTVGGRRGSANVGLLPFDRFASVTYVQVHANCRLRRIWFTAGPEAQGRAEELEIYGAG